jgi:PKD repeat protein/photosystem II stability/assembly factor-like uncharacterized protein
MKDPNANFFEVQKAFNQYYEKAKSEKEREQKREKRRGIAVNEEEESEVPGYFQYKRWEWFMASRVSANGDRFDKGMLWHETRKYAQRFNNNKVMGAGNWTFIGPTYSSNLAGAGRLNFIRIDPNNSQNLFVGSPSGGLWKSTNGGNSWTTNTDWISPVIGCTDIAIDPSNSNIMYLATGDGDAGDTYSVGLLKSTDGGATWNTTGLSYSVANYRQISKLLLDPTNTNTILAATSGGIYRSTDAGATFTQVQAGAFKDMEFKPNDYNTVYCCGSEFYKSTDNGQTWTKITSGLPVATNVSRMAIAVTEADDNYVYLIAGLPQPNYGTEGFYRSTNSGTGFTKISTPGLGTQQWYDLCIDASPGNSQEILLGGQTDFLRSTNGGSSWSQNGGNTHVDYHDVIYTNNNSYYLACDGGIYRTTNSGSSWSNLNNNLEISQMYGFGQSSNNANLIINGWQDNGTNRLNGVTWSQILGGDGMLCFIDWNNNNNMWAEYYNGALQRSTNGGASFSSAIGNINEAGAWVTPWLQDPVASGTIYAGFINVWKSTNGGTSWTKLSTFTNTATLNTLAVSAANNQVLWAAKAGALYKSSNGGSSWTTITTVPPGTITGIACSNTDQDKAWITYSGFTNWNKVLQTNDQGATWVNISASIPNIPVNCITYHKNSNDGIYIGTDIGVFYKDASMNVWQPFLNGLPNVVVTQLEIFYPTNKLRASTYGRGMWESDLFVAGAYAPTAAFDSDKKISCPGAAVQFSDYSAGQPTAWNWTFTGGTPAASNQQNPLVYYNTPGTYPVTLIVTNANGGDTVTYSNFITISSSPVSAPSTTGAVLCAPGIANLSAAGSGTGTLRWWDAPGGGNLLATGNTYSPTVTATTTYYVDEDFPSGNQDYTGAFDRFFGAGAFFTANDIRGLYFDVLQPVILNSVDVYSNSAGNRTIEIIDPQGNTYIDTTIYVPASPNTGVPLTLNFTLYPGNSYFIKCRGYVDLYRNSSGAIYPYSSPLVNITGTNASLPGYYYFFYNWVYTAITCNTERASCTATDTCSTIGMNELTGSNAIQVFPNPSSDEVTLFYVSPASGNYLLEITNAIGQVVYRENLFIQAGEFEKKIDLSNLKKGVCLITLSLDGHKAVEKLVIY